MDSSDAAAVAPEPACDVAGLDCGANPQKEDSWSTENNPNSCDERGLKGQQHGNHLMEGSNTESPTCDRHQNWENAEQVARLMEEPPGGHEDDAHQDDDRVEEDLQLKEDRQEGHLLEEECQEEAHQDDRTVKDRLEDEDDRQDDVHQADARQDDDLQDDARLEDDDDRQDDDHLEDSHQAGDRQDDNRQEDDRLDEDGDRNVAGSMQSLETSYTNLRDNGVEPTLQFRWELFVISDSNAQGTNSCSCVLEHSWFFKFYPNS
jgi:hypothetical protein